MQKSQWVNVENQVVGVFPGPKFDDAEGADQGAAGAGWRLRKVDLFSPLKQLTFNMQRYIGKTHVPSQFEVAMEMFVARHWIRTGEADVELLGWEDTSMAKGGMVRCHIVLWYVDVQMHI